MFGVTAGGREKTAHAGLSLIVYIYFGNPPADSFYFRMFPAAAAAAATSKPAEFSSTPKIPKRLDAVSRVRSVADDTKVIEFGLWRRETGKR